MYLVLSGTPVAYVNDERRMLHAGDYVIFRSGLMEVHYLANETQESVKLLQISSCPPDDVVEQEQKAKGAPTEPLRRTFESPGG
jgi:uncharacterized cupin superfamily protein